MSTLIFTIAQNGYSTAFLQCIKSQRKYAQDLGANFVAITEPKRVPDTSLSAWLKIPILLHALESGYDWVGYIDADCQVQKRAIDFREHLNEVGPGIFMAYGRSGRVNSGVIFARKSAEAIGFLHKVLSTITQPIPAEDRASLKYENGNVIYVQRNWGGVQILDPRWNNATDSAMQDYIRHYTGQMRSTLRRPLWRELQFQFLRRTRNRQFIKFKSQPEQREQSFLSNLQALELQVRKMYPTLVLE